MDLYAYSNIPNLEALAESNGIVVPRLRGYSLMSDEAPLSAERIERAVQSHIGGIYERACESEPRFRPDSTWFAYSRATDKLKRKYIITEVVKDDEYDFEYEKVVGFRWDLIHGKNRKAIKFAVKKARRAVENYYRIYNKYAGRNDVLRVHARIGGGNWRDYFQQVVDKPWFLEKVDDYFDDTYCDIFAKITIPAENV